MIRGRNNVRNHGRVREPEHEYSEPETHMLSKRWGYEMRKPERYYSEYNYNTYNDRYNGWKNIYREDEYSDYDSEYDSDDDGSYRYDSRSRYYDYYYDTPDYTSYRDRYGDRSHSECRTCNKHGKRRRARMFDDSSSLYRYEKDRPKYRDSRRSYKQKNKTDTPAVNNRTKLGNNLDIYAISNILNQTGFNYGKRYSITEPTLKSESVSETEIDSKGYKDRIQKRKRKPEHRVYTTRTNVASVFDKKTKHRYPEKLISVTDYEETPMLAFKDKNKRGRLRNNESDLVYLPVVMKTKYKKGKTSEQNLKTNRNDISIYTVSTRPSNVFRKAHAYSNNLKKVESKAKNDFTDHIPKTKYPFVYTASEVRNNNMMGLETDQNIRKSSLRKSSVQPTYQIGVNDRKSSAVGQQNVSGLQNMDTKNKNSQLKSKIELSNAVSKNTRASKASYSNNQPYLGSDLPYPRTSTTDFDTEGQSYQQSVFRKSTADPRSQNIGGRRRSSVYGQTNSIINLQNHDFPNENVKKSLGSMNNILIPSETSIEGRKSITSPQRDINNIQTTMIKQNIRPKSILRHTTDQSQIVRKRSLARPEQLIKYSVAGTNQNSEAKQGSVARKSQGIVASDQILAIDGENVQKTIIRQGSVARRGQSFVENEQVTGIEGENRQKRIARNSTAPEIRQSIQNNYDVMGTEHTSTPKSSIRQSIGKYKTGQSYVGRDQVMGTEDQNIHHKSMIMQSSARRGQSFVDRDQLITTEEDNTKRSIARIQSIAPHSDMIVKDEGQKGQRSMARNISKSQDQNFIDRNQSSVARKGQSFVDSAQVIGVEGDNIRKSMIWQRVLPEGEQMTVDGGEITEIEGQSTTKSMARQSSVAQRKQSIGGQNTQKFTLRRSSVAERDTLGGRKSGSQEIEISNQQPQDRISGPSAAYKYSQEENSVVRQKMNSINEQGELADNPQGTVEKHGNKSQYSTKFKRPKRTKSKSLLKKALSKLSTFQGHSEKTNHSDSTTPILDVILNEANVESRIEYQRLPPFPQPSGPLSSASVESFKKPSVSKKSKKSTTSKLKSLLWKPKKSEAKQKPNSVNATQIYHEPTAMTNQPSDDQQQSSPSEFDQTSDQSDDRFPPTYQQEPRESSDDLHNFFESTLKGYDLTPIIYFLHIAQLIVGATMFDKLMEVLEVF